MAFGIGSREFGHFVSVMIVKNIFQWLVTTFEIICSLQVRWNRTLIPDVDCVNYLYEINRVSGTSLWAHIW